MAISMEYDVDCRRTPRHEFFKVRCALYFNGVIAGNDDMLCLVALEGASDIRTQAEQQTGNHFVSDEL
jgi:hypothetical protein